MSLLSCYPTASADDGRVTYRTLGVYPPTDLYGVATDENSYFVDKTYSGGYYTNSVALVKFDTSAIPVGSSVSAATLNFNVEIVLGDADARNVNVEWYATSNWPIDATDYAENVGTTAAAVDLSTLTAGWNSIALSNLGSLVVGSSVGLRIGVSGGQPTGVNEFYVYFFDSGGNKPYLSITYTTGYQHKVNGVASASIAKVCGVPTANIRKVNGL